MVAHLQLGPFELSGAATLGLLFFDVDGNGAQFDEDLNLERGLFLRDLSLAGRRAPGAAGPESFSLDALGIGTRSTSARAQTSWAGVDLLARYGRGQYTGTSESDVHSFDFEREQGSLSLSHEASAGNLRRAGIELAFGHRDGQRLGSMSLGTRFVPDTEDSDTSARNPREPTRFVVTSVGSGQP
jgi:hypothetical protein